ncbi:MAG: NYN domain-containing protein [Candidatus Brocadiae bacterium]|nr:NYN domain-containing protein [Candidatus Brocadiia bacterium]
MMFYVDGNDLLEHLRERSDPTVVEGDHTKSRHNLARWMARYCEARDCRAVLVFDGQQPGEALPPTGHFGRTTVTNLPYGEGALTEIAGPANRSAVEERTFVVTADHRTAQALARGRATVLQPQQFIKQARKFLRSDDQSLAQEPDEKFTTLTDPEVDFWENYFKRKE